MITEAYIKGVCDSGMGKFAVVVVEYNPDTQSIGVVDRKYWSATKSVNCSGIAVEPNQANMETMAAIWAVTWCTKHNRRLLNIYADSEWVSQWYFRRDFPDTHSIGKIYIEKANDIDVFADCPPYKEDNKYCQILNEILNKETDRL